MTEPSPSSAHASRRGTGVARIALAVAAAAVLAAAGGFVWFAAHLPAASTGAARADAIVVLTGGRDRIAEGLRLLDAGSGRRLLISGVNRDVSRADLAAGFAEDAALFACCVDLGFEARSTLGNARETADWATRHGYGSLIVVTSDYHMPRSLLVLGEALPGVELVPHAVPHPAGGLWRDLAVARILVWEYAKYVVTLVRLQTA